MEKKIFIISEVNNFSETDFLKIFGNIVEHYPKVAKYLFTKLPFENIENVCEIAQQYLENLAIEDKECVLKMHPDLAGKLADMGNLTIESSDEQKSAGLNALTTEEKYKLTDLNNAYKIKFGFPFVICARENKVPAIFTGLEYRLQNTREKELEMGIDEVKKICKIRIMHIIA